MHITCLDVTISDDDLNSVISRHVPMNNKISNIRAALEDNHLIFTGHIRVLLTMNFRAAFAISFTEKEIIARLTDIHPMSGLVQQFKSKILQKIVAFAPFARLDEKNESIRIQVNEIVKNYGLKTNLSVADLAVAEKSLTLKLTGTINL
ncbi:hypothetical protein EH223_06200 [candidate division KSB1 bacterium]|nr:hypothetical protein [candidate division KSB1 bacterium]RQW05031.1 MAG: hypothetical protein EH223_06200 [candidate division KSB1 bacterium]